MEYNLCEDSPFEGAFVEISFGPLYIRYNEIHRCGSPGWFPSPAIQNSACSDVYVYGNKLYDCVQGIVGMQQGRPEEPAIGSVGRRNLTPAGYHRLSNYQVYDNEMHFQNTQTGDVNQTGIAYSPTYTPPGGSAGPYDTTAPDIWTGRNINFYNNDYFVAGWNGTTGNIKWAWQNAHRTWAQWKAYGHDLTGSVSAE
jgi:hypothetical protein